MDEWEKLAKRSA